MGGVHKGGICAGVETPGHIGDGAFRHRACVARQDERYGAVLDGSCVPLTL